MALDSRWQCIPPHHTHPVFHDHFALLSAEHVPQEFSPPITNLLVRLPRAMFGTCMQGRAAARDHCYSRHSQQTSLKLSVPRSLLRTTCVCSGAPLMFCSMCHALYHVSCTYRNLCPSCCKCQVYYIMLLLDFYMMVRFYFLRAPLIGLTE